MNITSTKRELRGMVAQTERIKEDLQHEIEVARLLLKFEDIHDLRDLTLELGNNVATAESFLKEFGKVSFSAKRFSVQQGGQ